MRGPKRVSIELSEEERQALEALVRRKSTGQQVALRARMILAAAEGLNNAPIGRQLGVEADTVRLWRRALAGLASGRPSGVECRRAVG